MNSRYPEDVVTKKESNRNQLSIKTQFRSYFDDRWCEVKFSNKNILPRSNHVVVFDSKTSTLYVHGGSNPQKGVLSDFFSVNLSDSQIDFLWKQLESKVNGQPLKLQNHTALLYKNQIVIFGGHKGISESSNSLYTYDLQNKAWAKKPIKSGQNIPKVESHSICGNGQNMYIYGGYVSSEGNFLKNIYCLDLEKFEWKTVYLSKQGQEEPEGRSNTGLVYFKESLWLFGGTNGKKTLQDMWRFNLTDKKWQRIENMKGDIPEPRSGHSMALFKEFIFLFGGIQDVTREKNDVFVYELNHNRWSKIHSYTNNLYQCSPTLRREKRQSTIRSVEKVSPTRSPLKNSQSGQNLMRRIMWENKQKKFVQKKKELFKSFIQKDENVKNRRLSPTTQSLMKSLESVGSQQTNLRPFFNNKQIVYDESHRFIVGKKPCARDGHQIAVGGNKMYILGGDRHIMAYNDMYVFDLDKGLQSLSAYRKN